MGTKAAWAWANLLVKWGMPDIEGVNQWPSHLTLSLGLKPEPSRWIGAWDIGPLSLFVPQWMSSVLGMENLTPSVAPLDFSRAYCLCRIWMFRRYDVAETVRPKEST